MRGPASRMEPMLVTLRASRRSPRSTAITPSCSACSEATWTTATAGATYEVSPGDALEFDAQVAHGPVGVGSLPVQFLSVTAYGDVGATWADL